MFSYKTLTVAKLIKYKNKLIKGHQTKFKYRYLSGVKVGRLGPEGGA